MRVSKHLRNMGAILWFVLGGGLLPLHGAPEFRTFTSTDGKTLEARVVKKTDTEVTLVRKKDSREFTLSLALLSEGDRKYLEGWVPEADTPRKETEAAAVDWSKVEKRYYPKTLEELREGFEKVKATAQGSESDDVHEALVELNMFRFACDVPLTKLDKTFLAQAQEAADAVRAHGKLSHDLGHYTAVCNLGGAVGAGKPEAAGMINDRGEENRGHRGHRMESLHYQLAKTGFAYAGEFFAQRTQEYSGKAAKKPYAYPGMGLYPLSLVVGNGWSLYLTEPAPAASDLKVQVWKLKERPTKRIASGDEPEGEELPVDWVSVERFGINFEPAATALNKEPGIYFVRVKGGGVREDYVVDLFDDKGWPCEYSGNEKD